MADYLQGRRNCLMTGTDGLPAYLRQGTGNPPWRKTPGKGAGGERGTPAVDDDSGDMLASISNMEVSSSAGGEARGRRFLSGHAPVQELSLEI